MDKLPVARDSHLHPTATNCVNGLFRPFMWENSRRSILSITNIPKVLHFVSSVRLEGIITQHITWPKIEGSRFDIVNAKPQTRWAQNDLFPGCNTKYPSTSTPTPRCGTLAFSSWRYCWNSFPFSGNLLTCSEWTVKASFLGVEGLLIFAVASVVGGHSHSPASDHLQRSRYHSQNSCLHTVRKHSRILNEASKINHIV